MNQIIKDVLAERAEQARTPHVDPAGLIRSGRRRRTARRGTGVVAVVAAVASAVAVAPTIVERLPGGGSDQATMNPAPGLDLAWADADYLYFGDHRTPRPGGYFDLTSHENEVLYTTWKAPTRPGDFGRGAVYEWRPSGGGEPEVVVDDAVSPPEVEGNLAAWTEAAGPDQDQVVLRVGDTEYRSDPIPETRYGPSIGTLDDSGTPTVTYSNGRQLWIWNGRDSPTRLDVGADDFIDRANGLTVVRDGFSSVLFLDTGGREIGEARDVSSDGLLDEFGERYLTRTSEFPGPPAVVDVPSGRSTPLDIGRSNRALQMAWDLHGNVAMAISPKGDDPAPVDLVTCDPAYGECTVVAEAVGKFSDVILAGETYAGL